MAEPAPASVWLPRGAWDGIVAEGRIGAAGTPGVTVLARDGLGIATLIAAEGGEAALAAAIGQRLGLDLPASPVAARSDGHSLAWAGPGQWLLVGGSRSGFAETLAAFSGLAAVSDQSDGRAALRLSGARIRHALAKGCMIDLHPTAFPVGATALTSIAHMGVHLWRAADGPDGAVFEIMVARSMAGSFWSWFSASVAEFGCDVTTARAATGRG
jgi:sarcosine oxidase subunit gamma